MKRTTAGGRVAAPGGSPPKGSTIKDRIARQVTLPGLLETPFSSCKGHAAFFEKHNPLISKGLSFHSSAAVARF
ncbi:MAG TPA: hypothetical protein VMW27_29675 [Thermoanaerobaculia bacterium]|nr:hypothetical protein [Thermoanaerobaculia bacterium]